MCAASRNVTEHGTINDRVKQTRTYIDIGASEAPRLHSIHCAVFARTFSLATFKIKFKFRCKNPRHQVVLATLSYATGQYIVSHLNDPFQYDNADALDGAVCHCSRNDSITNTSVKFKSKTYDCNLDLCYGTGDNYVMLRDITLVVTIGHFRNLHTDKLAECEFY